jgi:molybdopterin converting factor small subunit
VTVTYYNIVADFFGRREDRWELPAGTTVKDLVAALGSECASFRKLAFTAEGQVSGHLRLFCNGQAVLDLDQELADEDEIRAFPAISGG